MTQVRQAVLLAAGKGTRLLPHTQYVPKCMVEVAGTPIVDHLVAAAAPLQLDEWVVVTGYLSDVLEKHFAEAHPSLNVRFIDNPDYATTNNIYSLYLAIDAIRAPFALLESDIFAAPRVVGALSEPDRMVVARYTEQMDGTGVRVGDGGAVEQMILGAHKTGVDLTTLHKTVNFYSFSEATWTAYRAALQRAITVGRLGDYYEAVLAELINDGSVGMRAVDATSYRWTEIDDPDDLRAAEQMLTPPR
jgi:choline kinase